MRVGRDTPTQRARRAKDSWLHCLLDCSTSRIYSKIGRIPPPSVTNFSFRLHAWWNFLRFEARQNILKLQNVRKYTYQRYGKEHFLTCRAVEVARTCLSTRSKYFKIVSKRPCFYLCFCLFFTVPLLSTRRIPWIRYQSILFRLYFNNRTASTADGRTADKRLHIAQHFSIT